MLPIKRSFLAAGFYLLAASIGLLSGCHEQPRIERARVPKPPKITAEDRMLAAVVPVGQKGWFFKLSGKSELVTAELPKFQQLLQSLEVDGENLKWSKPDGWNEEAGSGMRAATFKIGDKDSKFECTVIALPADDPKSDDYLLSNINRWRGQIGLGNISKAEIAKAGAEDSEIRKVTLKDGTPITWVNLEGVLSSGGSMPFADGAPFANAPFAGGADGGGRRPMAGPEMPNGGKPAGQVSDEFTFDVPAGWKPGPSGEFRKAAFVVTDGGDKAEITVSSLSAAGSGLVANVNRWRGQVALPNLDEAALQKTLEPLTISGQDGHFVELMGEQKAILGAVVVVGDQGWFFKLSGPKQLASKEKQNFLDFVKSTKFK